MGFDRKRKGKTQRQEKTQEIPGTNPTRTPGFDEYKVETIWFSFFVLAFQHTTLHRNFSFVQIFQPLTAQLGNVYCRWPFVFSFVESNEDECSSVLLHAFSAKIWIHSGSHGLL